MKAVAAEKALVGRGLLRDCKTSNFAKVRLQLYWGGAGAGTGSSHSHLGTADTSTTNTRKLATEAEVGSEQQQQLSDSISTVQVLSEKLNVELPFRNTVYLLKFKLTTHISWI